MAKQGDKSKRRYRKKAIPIRIGDAAPKERGQHQGGLVIETIDRTPNGRAVVKRQRAIAECVLDAYYIREIINDAEYIAGMKFRRAYLRAVLHIKVDDTGGGSHCDPEEAALVLTRSRRLLQNAYKILSEPEIAEINDVCGLDDWGGGEYRMKFLHSGLEKLIALWKITDFPN